MGPKVLDKLVVVVVVVVVVAVGKELGEGEAKE